MPNSVKGKGPLDARVIVLGEAPGRHEDRLGTCFVGQSGNLQERWIKAAGLDSNYIRFDNVYPYYPPGGKITNVSLDEINHYIGDLGERLANLSDPWLIVPVGNLALYALTELVKPKPTKKGWEFTSPGISTYRGSIYSTDIKVHDSLNWIANKIVKVIPTIHPAAILYSAGGATREGDEEGFKKTISWEKRCRADWIRIAKESQFRELRLPERMHLVDPSTDELEQFWERLEAQGEPILAIDIETNPKTGDILCVGFAHNSSYSITIPWTTKWKKNWIKKLCQSWCEKVLQGGYYDVYWLAQEGTHIKNYVWDTLLMHHALDSLEEHSLAFLTSIYTKEPYYKDEGKFENQKGEVYRDFNRLMQYCGKDACVTRELVDTLYDELANIDRGIRGVDRGGEIRKKDGVNYYFDQYYSMIQPILDLMLHGVQVDQTRMKTEYDSLTKQCLELRDKLTELNDGESLFKLTTKRDRAVYEALQMCNSNGWNLLLESEYIHKDTGSQTSSLASKLRKSKNKFYSPREVQTSLDRIRDKSISNQELMKCLYQKHSLPQQTKLRKSTGERTPTIDGVALRKLRNRFGARRPEVAKIIDTALEYAKLKKTSEFYNETRLDSDSRMRCTYKIGGTESSRLSSSKNPKGTGTNLHNPQRDTRAIFVPDKDCVFLEIDLSTAEDRVVKALAYAITGNKDLLDRARAMPWENDEHKRAARAIYGVHTDNVTPQQRQHAKSVRHGLNYDMREVTMSEGFLKEGETITPQECKRMIQALANDEPEIAEWQKHQRMQIIRHRKLVNSWGMEWAVPYERLVPDLYRRAYAFVPQSEVGKLLNMWGLVPLSKWIRKYRLFHENKIKINLQVHDSLVISCPYDQVHNVAWFLKESLEQPRTYQGIELSIPCEYAVGKNWNKKEMHQWNRLPSREEMTEVAYEMMKGKRECMNQMI